MKNDLRVITGLLYVTALTVAIIVTFFLVIKMLLEC